MRTNGFKAMNRTNMEMETETKMEMEKEKKGNKTEKVKKTLKQKEEVDRGPS